jgi:hypothetical protein
MSTSIPYRIIVGDEDKVRMSNINPEEDLDDMYGLGVVIDCKSGIGSNVDVGVAGIVAVDVGMEDGDNDVGMVVIGTGALVSSSSDGLLVGDAVGVVVPVKEEDDDDDDVVDDAVGDNVVTIDMEMEVVSDNDTGVLLELVVSAASDNGSDG